MKWGPLRGHEDVRQTPSGAEDGPAPPRRWRAIALVAGIVVVLGAGAGAATLGLGGRHRAVAHTKVTLTSAVITRCTLTDSQNFPGQTTFGTAHPLPVQSQGLITWLPKAGTVVREGQTLVRTDDRPVVLLYGQLPQYRTLRAPAVQATPSAPVTATATTAGPPPSMHGSDVRELKRSLTRLGYRGLDTGENYTRSTASVVKRWQRDLGEDPTGTVQLGDIFVAAGPLRVVAGPDGVVGQPMSATALQWTSRTRVVTATVDDTSTWAQTGAKLSIDAGQTGSIPAVVTSVSAADSTSSDGGQNLQIVASVADQSALNSAGTAVTVTHLTTRRANVLCAPSAALVALAEGGYGLEPEAGTYLAVQIGLFAQGKVEVSGAGVHAGLRVFLPVGD
jgi:hypothetical protein